MRRPASVPRGADFRLTIQDDGLFRLDIRQPDEPHVVGHGTWHREAARLTFETQNVELDPDKKKEGPEGETPFKEPPPVPGEKREALPPMHATIAGDTLVMHPSEVSGLGIPFEHRYVRAPQ